MKILVSINIKKRVSTIFCLFCHLKISFTNLYNYKNKQTNTKIPFNTAAETALSQVSNGKILGGHLGVTQGYLTYTFFVVQPANETGHKVIVDAGNGKVLHTSEGFPLGAMASSWKGPGEGQWQGFHGPGKPMFGGWHGPFAP